MIDLLIIKAVKAKKALSSFFIKHIYVRAVLPPLRRSLGFAAGRQQKAARARHERSPLKAAPDTFALCRIVGNDLPPRHRKGQTRENLRFILEHEHEFPGCIKIWVLNRIIDQEEKREIEALLKNYGSEYIDIPFDRNEYLKIGLNERDLPSKGFVRRYVQKGNDEWLRLTLESHRLKNKNLYLMNNNGARNLALNLGREKAKWILPWDGNCFLTLNAWSEISQAVSEQPWNKYFIVPMARIVRNDDLLQAGYNPLAEEEPQIIFRRDAVESFDESYAYGTMSKVELLWRLRVPGPWDLWPRVLPWGKRRKRAYSPEAFQFSRCGWVARLNSGNDAAEGSLGNRGLDRVRGIVEFIKGVDASLRRETSAR